MVLNIFHTRRTRPRNKANFEAEIRLNGFRRETCVSRAGEFFAFLYYRKAIPPARTAMVAMGRISPGSRARLTIATSIKMRTNMTLQAIRSPAARSRLRVSEYLARRAVGERNRSLLSGSKGLHSEFYKFCMGARSR